MNYLIPFFIFICITFCGSVFCHIPLEYDIFYDSKIRPSQIKIFLKFNTGDNESIYINKPDIWGSSKINYDVKIISIKPSSATLDQNKLLVPKNTNIQIEYIIKQDYSANDPNRIQISNFNFMAYGHHLWILPNDTPKSNNQIVSAILNWHTNGETIFTNSFGSSLQQNLKNSPLLFNQKVKTSVTEFLDGLYIGGDYLFELNQNKNNTILFHEDYSTSTKPPNINYIDNAKKIISYQQKTFNDNNFPYQVIVFKINNTLPIGVVDATKLFNAVIIQASGKTFEGFPERINATLSHETMHFWFSEKTSNHSAPYPRWFFEGINDYFAFKNVYHLGLISSQYYCDYLNGFILINSYIPGVGISSDEIENNYFNIPFVFFHPYARGHLFAIELNRLITRHSNHKIDLSNVMINILSSLKEDKNEFTVRYFEATLKNLFGKDFIKSYSFLKKLYILEGKPFSLSDECMSPIFELKEIKAANNDFGFDFYKSVSTGIITNVKKRGLAYKSGLRNNQKLISYDYDINNRFDPVVLTIKAKHYNQKSITVPIKKVPTKLKIFALAKD